MMNHTSDVFAAGETAESPSLTPTEAFTRFVEMKAMYQKERSLTRRNEIMMDQLAVEMETKLAAVHHQQVPSFTLPPALQELMPCRS